VFAATALTLVLALLFGGGQGWTGERLLALPALALIGWVAWLWLQPSRIDGASTPPENSRGRLIWLLPMALLLLPALQLVPLPYAVWSQLPGRAPIAAALQSAGVPAGWRPWSLAPFETERMLESLLTPCSLFMAALTLDSAQRRHLVQGALLFAALSALLGLWQVVEGPDSPLYVYAVTNHGETVGLFANRNHLGSLLVSALPVAAGLLADQLRHHRLGLRDLRAAVLGGLLLLLVVTITATRSRAAFLLLMFSVAASAAVLWRGRRHADGWNGGTHWLQVGAVVALVLVVQYTLYALLLRLQSDPLDDLRWSFAANALQVASFAQGTGFGFGSFVPAYALAGEAAASTFFYVNHAHNDFVELWLEGGAPAALLMAVALFALGRVLRQQWRAQLPGGAGPGMQRSHHRGLALGAALALALLALHSLLDYPLRTLTLQCWAALLIAVLVGFGRRAPASEAVAAGSAIPAASR
jgi:O-antigen ligase